MNVLPAVNLFTHQVEYTDVDEFIAGKGDLYIKLAGSRVGIDRQCTGRVDMLGPLAYRECEQDRI